MTHTLFNKEFTNEWVCFSPVGANVTMFMFSQEPTVLVQQKELYVGEAAEHSQFKCPAPPRPRGPSPELIYKTTARHQREARKAVLSVSPALISEIR